VTKKNQRLIGRFISLEGGEGAGKSTQIESMKKYIESKGKKVILTREPGGSTGSEELRELLVSGEQNRWDPISETLIIYAARREHWIKKIKPALEEGLWVISDRFSDSTIVYQGYGKGVSRSLIRNLHSLTLGETYPDLTLILDIPAEIGLKRSLNRDQETNTDNTRFENMELSFHKRVREGFKKIAAKHPNRVHSLNAEKPVEEVTKDNINLVSKTFNIELNSV